ncbi:MAG: hypothetical protein AB9835_08060 [Eubacteriales bacterium]
MKRTAITLTALFLCLVMSGLTLAKEISFTVYTDAENTYIYEEIGTGNDAGSRFCDGTNYVVYKFTYDEGDTAAQVSMMLANQYIVSATNKNPDDEASYETVLAIKVPENPDQPSWGLQPPAVFTIDLSKFITADNTDKAIYVKVGDIQTDNGWGGYISKNAPVSFVSSAGAIVDPTEAPTEAPATATEAPVAATEAPVAETTAFAEEAPAAPQTSDSATVALVLLALAAGAVVLFTRKQKI